MKIKIMLIIIFFSAITNVFAQEYIVSSIPLKMKVYDNNKLTDTKILASFYFYKDKLNNWQGFWQYIDFYAVDEEKAVMAGMHLYSIQLGEIINFTKLNDNAYSFDLKLTTIVNDRTAKVILKKLPHLEWHAEVNIFSYSELINDTVNIKWITSDEDFIKLKYRKIK